MTVLDVALEEKAAQIGLMDRLIAELVELWRALFGARAATQADIADFTELVVPLVQQYGAASGLLAREFYDRQRVEAGVTDRFEVPQIDPPEREQIAASVAWALNPQRHRRIVERDSEARPQVDPGDASEGRRQREEDDAERERLLRQADREAEDARQRRQRERERLDREYEEFERQQERDRQREQGGEPVDLDRIGERQIDDLAGAMPRIARETGRLTLENAVEQDPRAVAYARVTGPNPCGFCAMLASRGYVYRAENAAQRRGRNQLEDKYHDHCQCTVVVTWASSRGELPDESRDADDLWRRSGAKFSDPKDARAAMERALQARRDGRDIDAAVIDGPPGDPDRYRRKTRTGQRPKRKNPAVPGRLPAGDTRRVLA